MSGQETPGPTQSARVVALARTWLGTPYLHQASCRGAGCDCLGLIRGIWRDLRGAEPQTPPPYSMDWSEPQGEERLWQAALTHLVAKPLEQAAQEQAAQEQAAQEQAALGDVLLFRMRAGSVAKHLGVQSELGGRSGAGAESGGAFIHAYYGQGVVQSALTSPWQRRIVARFSFPEEQV